MRIQLAVDIHLDVAAQDMGDGAVAQEIDHALRACAVRRGVVDQQPAGQQVVTGEDQSGPVVMEYHLPGMMSRRGHHAYFPVAQVHAAGARPCIEAERSAEHTSELQSLMRLSYAV